MVNVSGLLCLDHSNVCLLVLGLRESFHASCSSQHRLPVIQFCNKHIPQPNLGISDGISHSRSRWRHTVSSDKEVGGEEHSEIAPVQTHQRQRGRLEASTAPASDRTAVAFRPIRYQMATLSSQLCSHTGDAKFLRVAPSVGKTLYNCTQCYRNFIIYALKYLYKLNILAPTISPVLTQSFPNLSFGFLWTRRFNSQHVRASCLPRNVS